MQPLWRKHEKRPLAHLVAVEIRDAILEWRLVPEARLTEAEVAQGMDVSRATVREAFRQLQAEGLLLVAPWRGATVIGLSERDISEVVSLRAQLEAFAIELATARLSLETRGQLEKSIEALSAAGASGDIAAVNKADYDFHHTVWEIADHRRVLQALELMSPTIRALIAISNRVDPLPESIAEHRRIFEAVVSCRAEVAQRLMHDHLRRFGDSVLREVRRRRHHQARSGANDQRLKNQLPRVGGVRARV